MINSKKLFASLIGSQLGKIYDIHAVRKYLRKNFIRWRKQESTKALKYPYELIDPRTLSEPVSGLDNFFLVGDSWRQSETEKPIVLLVGFNDWKYGFIADFLPEYRCAFAPMKKGALFFLRNIKNMDIKPKSVYIWGYSEPRGLKYIQKILKLNFIRVEDAFIRSAEIGAKHNTPYSLVFDKSGVLHYDPSQPSDIEKILNDYDFSSHSELLKNAETLQDLICRKNLTKYNPPSTKSADPFVAFTGRKRVAVIGQVDNDMSIRKGNVDGWSMMEAIELAAYENPGCEILYRPHPEANKDIDRSSAKAARIEKLCHISPPDDGLAQFLDSVDHVYVITSLSGLEALLRGKKVTVLGAPFYAGWGLTDDRVKLPRRTRALTLTELFAGAYLLYPKYLGSLEDSTTGLMAASHRICADRIIGTQKFYKRIINPNVEAAILLQAARSDYWPTLLFSREGQAHEEFDKVIVHAPFYRLLKWPQCRIYQAIILHAVCGALKTDGARQAFLVNIRDFIEPEIFAVFLTRLRKLYPGNSSIIQWSWLLEEHKETSSSFDLIHDEIEYKAREVLRIEKSVEPVAPNANASEIVQLDMERRKLLYTLIDKCLENNKYGDALEHVCELLLSGGVQSGLLLPAIKIAELTFDFASASAIADLLKKANIEGHNNAGVNYLVECMSTTLGDETLEEVLENFCLQLVLNPDRVNRTLARLNDFSPRAQTEALSHAILAMDGSRDVRMANAWLEMNRPLKALAIMEHLIDRGERSDTALAAYSQALAGCGECSGAIHLMETAVAHSPSKTNYTELLRLLKSAGHFKEAYKHYRDALAYKVNLPLDGPVMPIFFGLKRIEEGFRCFLDTAVRDRLIAYFGAEKYQNSDQLEMDELLLLCSFGPAEEIRYSVLLSEIGARFGYKNFTLACDPRLLPLFTRSFPRVRFAPIRRTREFGREFPHADFNRLPGADLRNVLDNNGLVYVEKAKKIMLFSETFWHFRKTYKDFSRSPYLLPDTAKVSTYRRRLPKNSRLVGLSWRSQLTNARRNVSYLSVQELEPIFALEGITYVNLQYDDCAEELAWVNRRYPGKIINFDEIDHFNDFDSVAALMSALDLVIGPCTAVIELAGALGCPGFLFTNHGEMWWREIGPERQDVWYESIRHVRGVQGKKSTLVTALASELKCWMANKNSQANR
jgi:capsular polysaccharide export protein